MTDRELLEKAARAAGIRVVRSRLDDPMTKDMLINVGLEGEALHHSSMIGWNPLTDDGDALRLAVKLGLHVFSNSNLECSFARKQDGPHIEEEHGSDEYAATRRAIVRAAAEIGKSI